MSDAARAALAAARYASLATFRRDGREVRTPVWFAGTAQAYYVFSAGEAGKVKRLRANGRARLAPCTAQGAVTGEWLDGSGRVLTDPADIGKAYQALRARYGWQMWLLDLLARVTGRYQRRALLAISLDLP